ncbi:hypothetical protein BpHYR1_026505 [Brachionus plicatilis]|uniref:Uncharacterized protein n=1 Tax=Brachionus plicatilis TaxID=10195 RepID=A0A3M7PB23_BRAPC|nr:hypothetical protein BpHYR1_026505 [Brachionus plicatilis]
MREKTDMEIITKMGREFCRNFLLDIVDGKTACKIVLKVKHCEPQVMNILKAIITAYIKSIIEEAKYNGAE